MVYGGQGIVMVSSAWGAPPLRAYVPPYLLKGIWWRSASIARGCQAGTRRAVVNSPRGDVVRIRFTQNMCAYRTSHPPRAPFHKILMSWQALQDSCSRHPCAVVG